MIPITRAFEAYLDHINLITILIPKNTAGDYVSSFRLRGPGLEEPLLHNRKIELQNYIKYECPLTFYVHIGNEYKVVDGSGKETDLQIGAVIRTDEFDKIFTYLKDDLGVTYKPEEALFKVWAPTATKAKLKLICPRTKEQTFFQMERLERGTWSCKVSGDFEGFYYAFLVFINCSWREAADPYAKAAAANSEYSVVIDLQKTRVPRPEKPPLHYDTDAIIYEVHVRDFSIHPKSGIKHRGKFLGMVEEGTKGAYGEVTGIDYIKGLGVTHVELLPVNDFAGVDELNPEKRYNWGYNPLYFQVPEGSYSSNPDNPYKRINELKETIAAFHRNGLRVIVDVVFNHVFIREESSFEQLVPGYYFRHDEYGMPSNGTGVGNDFASERAMARKFITDSVLFWAKEYGVDGFRFDLMGILDIETMTEIRFQLDQIDPSIIILGEGWDLNTPLSYERKATLQNAARLPRIAHFNDRFRDCIKGSTFNLYDRGFAFGHIHRTKESKQSVAGSIALAKGEKGLFSQPNQTINYVESHDNHTLWDKLIKCNDFEEEHILRKRQRLATSIVLLSQGIPFLHSGQEFYRTKQGVENSYNSPDYINWLDWERAYLYREDIEYIKGIIAIRKYHRAFRFAHASLIRQHLFFIDTNEHLIAYQLLDVKEFGAWSNIVVAFNNDVKPHSLPLKGVQEWTVAADDQQAGVNGYTKLAAKDIIVPPISPMVLFQY